jgi:hypothetical protein
MSHNTLVVDNSLQHVAGHSEIIEFSDNPANPYTIVDLSPVYQEQLTAARRGITLRPDGSVLVQDEIQTQKTNSNVRWGMVTHADVDIAHPESAILRYNDKKLTLQVLHPEDVRLKIYETENPPRQYDAANRNSRMIGFEIPIAPDMQNRLIVLLKPGGTSVEQPVILPLSQWSGYSE